MTTYAQAKTARTLAATRAARLAALSSGGAPVAGWSDNAPQRIQVDHDSQVLVDESVIRAAIAGMIDLSELASMDEDWCDAFAAWFGETRIAAIAAEWDIELSCTTAAAPITITPTTVVQIQAGSVVIESIAAVSATLNGVASQIVRFRARVAGTDGNSLVGTPKVIAGPAGLTFPGAPALATSGRDAETNSEMITRCLGKWARLGAGWTTDAFDYIIPTAAPTVTRWRVRRNAVGEGTVLAVLANASTAATGTEVDDVQAALDSSSVKPWGSGAFEAIAATEDALAITITVVGDGTNANLQTDIETALEALGDAFPLGPATLDVNLVRGVALGGAYPVISVDIGDTTTTITPDLPGFSGAVSISSLSLSSSHDVNTDEVLVITATVTVV